MATDDEIDRVIAILAVAYPAQNLKSDKETLRATVQLYHRLLQDIDGPLLEAATLQHIAHNKWFPTIAELREAALSLICHDEVGSEEAWIEVKRAIKAVGYYGIPQFSDPKIVETVRAFGWRDLCGYDADQEGVTRAHFMRIYDSLKRRDHDDRVMLPEVRAALTQRRIVGEQIKQLAERKRS